MILVTGGTGFLGRELVKRLQRDNDVLILTRRDLPNSVRGDVSDYNTVSKAIKDAEVVFHLAAESDQFAPYERHYSTTVLGTSNVMKAAAKTGAKVVYMSSAVVMKKYQTNYVKAKIEAEKIAKKYWDDLEVPIIRTSLVYDKEVVNRLKRLSYLPFPHKRVKTHLAYRGSVVEALIGAMNYGKSEIYPVADKEPVLLTQLIKEVARPRPVLWIPPQTIWLGIALFYPIEKVAEALNVRPPMTATYLRYLFEDSELDIEKSAKKLRYKPVDTLEMVRKLK